MQGGVPCRVGLCRLGPRRVASPLSGVVPGGGALRPGVSPLQAGLQAGGGTGGRGQLSPESWWSWGPSPETPARPPSSTSGAGPSAPALTGGGRGPTAVGTVAMAGGLGSPEDRVGGQALGRQPGGQTLLLSCSPAPAAGVPVPPPPSGARSRARSVLWGPLAGVQPSGPLKGP